MPELPSPVNRFFFNLTVFYFGAHAVGAVARCEECFYVGGTHLSTTLLHFAIFSCFHGPLII